MSLTIQDLQDRLKQLDETILLEVLNITSDEIVERFVDKIEDRFDELSDDLEEEWEE